MASAIEKKIKELGLTLPEASQPLANYVGYSVSGRLVFISGQLPIANGKLAYKGKVGKDISTDRACVAAKLCTLNILSQLKAAAIDTLKSKAGLDSVLKVVKIEGFVNSTDDYTDHPKVINGASDLIVQIFGDKGKHSRVAVGVNSLPMGTPVEISAIFELDF